MSALESNRPRIGRGQRPPAGANVRPQGKRARGRLFSSDLMERMTRVSPSTVVLTYVPVAGALIVVNFRQGYVPNAWHAAGLFVAGLAAWTLFGYLLHRYVYHLVIESEVGAKLGYMMHGLHHEFPRDRSRMFLPPPVVLALGAMVFGLMYAGLGTRTFMVFPGFLMGYMGHTYLHYCIHCFRPPRMLRFLWRHHLLHHYNCPDRAYGVSSPVWDMVFRTMPPAEPARTRLGEDPRRALPT